MVRPIGGVVLGAALATSVFAFDVTGCGQTVPKRQVGVLLQDMACGADPLKLDAGAALDLNGHTLTVTGPIGVECIGPRCTVLDRSVIPGGVRVGPDVQFGVLADKNLLLDRVRIVGGAHQYGAYAAGNLRATEVTLSGHGTALGGRRVRIAGAALEGCGTGVFSRSAIVATALVATGNLLGVRSAQARIALRDSTVTGNGIDLSGPRRPVLRNSTCDRSQNLASPEGLGNWAVCSLD